MEQGIVMLVNWAVGQGPMGILALALLGANYLQWRRENRLNSRLEALEEKRSDLQERRISEARESLKAVNDAVRTIDTQGALVKDAIAELRAARFSGRARG